MPDEITPRLLLQPMPPGCSPMAGAATSGELYWIDPERRGIHRSRRYVMCPADWRAAFLTRDFEIRIDADFAWACSRARADRPETGSTTRSSRLLSRSPSRASRIRSRSGATDSWRAGSMACRSAQRFRVKLFSRMRGSKFALIALRGLAAGRRLHPLDTQFVTGTCPGSLSMDQPPPIMRGSRKR